MPAYIVINSFDGTFRVHRKGCVDIRRKEGRRGINSLWEREADSAETLIESERESFRGDFGADADDFVFVVLPCAAAAKVIV